MRCLVLAFVIAFFACQAVSAVVQSESPTTDEQARLMMREAHYLWVQDKPREAIDILKKVVAYNPRLEANFPEEKIHLYAQAGLGLAYMTDGQWENALSAFDLAERFAQESGSREPTVLPIGMSRCRERLAADGKPPADAMIVIGGWLFRGRSIVTDGVALVSASELAPKLGLQVLSDGPETLAISTADKQKSLKMTVGSKTATAKDGTLQLPVSPQQDNKAILVPLRTIAEYFGVTVKWEPLSKVAWVQ